MGRGVFVRCDRALIYPFIGVESDFSKEIIYKRGKYGYLVGTGYAWDINGNEMLLQVAFQEIAIDSQSKVTSVCMGLGCFY